MQIKNTDKEKLILKDIQDNLLKNHVNEKEIGGLVGLSGIMIFDLFYNKYLLRDEQKAKVQYYLNLILDRINSNQFQITFCSGLSGFLWSLNLLKEVSSHEFESEEIIDQIENILYKKMTLDFSNNDFDFLHGGLGYSFYFLKKHLNTSQNDKYLKYLEESLAFLKRTAIQEDGDKLKWSSPIKQHDESVSYNFGLAHGIPSIIYFLAKLVENNILIQDSKPLLEKAVNYVLSNKLEENSLSIFPNAIKAEENYIKEKDHSRLAWCYGDLGVAMALLIAGKAMHNEKIINEATQVLINSCKRTDLVENNIVDAPLCHGIFGIAYIYLKAFRLTENKIFMEQSNYWYSVGLELYDLNGVGLQNYCSVNKFKNEYILHSSILEGLSGIGLALISKNNQDTLWDECLMLS